MFDVAHLRGVVPESHANGFAVVMVFRQLGPSFKVSLFPFP